jgi:cell division septal protein FtsQ
MTAGGGKREAGADENDGGQGRARSASRLKIALIGLGAAAVLSASLWAPLFLRRMAYFRVRRIEVVGAHYVAPSDILSRLHVDTVSSIWDPTKPLAARIAAHPDIATAVVERKLPGTLVVQVTERTPVALVPANGGFLAFDERGTSLRVDPSRVSIDVPILAERDTVVLRLLGAMRAKMPALYARLSEVRRGGRDELVLQLRNWPVRVMRSVTLERLADIDPIEEDLLRRQVRVAEIDLRYRDQVIARLQ